MKEKFMKNGVFSLEYDKETLRDMVLELQEKNEQLKKQLHEASIEMQEMIEQDIECPSNCSKLKEILNQQKEFIKYLEERYKDITSVIGSYGSNTDMLYGKKDILKEILQKYRSIIGVSDEKIYKR